MLKSDMNSLDYAAIEVIKKPGLKVADIECGVFMGIISHKSTVGNKIHFLVLLTKENVINMYNLAEYNVLTIQALSADMRYMTVFNNSVLDQGEAIDVLYNIIESMVDDKRLFDNTPDGELIDIDTYKNVPDGVLKENTLSGDHSKYTGKKTNQSKNTFYKNTNNAGSTYKAPKVEKPKVLTIKRKGRLPSKERLEKMRDLVMALASNDVVLPDVAHPACDKVEEKKTTV